MRRLIASILAILVLVMSCIPCSDAAPVPDAKGETSIVKSVSEKDCCGGHALDLCSPFCTCSCCAGFSVPTPVAFEPGVEVPVYSVRSYSLPPVQSLPEVHLPIWQPPQLG